MVSKTQCRLVHNVEQMRRLAKRMAGQRHCISATKHMRQHAGLRHLQYTGSWQPAQPAEQQCARAVAMAPLVWALHYDLKNIAFGSLACLTDPSRAARVSILGSCAGSYAWGSRGDHRRRCRQAKTQGAANAALRFGVPSAACEHTTYCVIDLDQA
jgi:hypothetical protein